MEVKIHTVTKTKVIIELEEWEAQDFVKMLTRIRDQKSVSKSEFTMREKRLGRKLITDLSTPRSGK